MSRETESFDIPSACVSCLDRRSLLAGAAGLAGAALLGTDHADAATSRGGSWRTLWPASTVPLHSGRYESDDGFRVVVTQPSAGVYRAFSGYCTHQAGELERFPGRRIECSSHGSQFRLNNGTVLRGPATRRLDRLEVRIRNGQVQVR